MRDFALEVYFSKWEFAAKYHMTASDIESMTIGELLNMAPSTSLSGLEQQWLGYTETFGSTELREEIAKTYNTATPSNIPVLGWS